MTARELIAVWRVVPHAHAVTPVYDGVVIVLRNPCPVEYLDTKHVARVVLSYLKEIRPSWRADQIQVVQVVVP